MNMIVVIGHRNPDTDSVVAAIAGSYFFNKIGKESRPARAGELNRETKFVLNFFEEKEPELIKDLTGWNFVLVDHNSVKESVEGRDDQKLVAVIDHHYLSGIQTKIPILYRSEPIGSTSTILAKMYWERKIDIPVKIAGLLLSGIISDTLKFNSPTTTDEDRQIAERLAQIANVDIDRLAEEMFEAKSNLDGIPIEEVISQDYKVFESLKGMFGVGVWETVKPEVLIDQKEKIITALREKKEKDKLKWLFFAVVDILKQNSYLLLIGDEEGDLAQRVFAGQADQGIMFLPGIVSRKKQVVPRILDYLNK